MAWTRIAAAALLLLAAAPSHARFDLGNVGIPTGNPGVLDPGDPPVFDPPPPPPPLAIRSSGLGWIELFARVPAGRTSELLRQPPGGSFAPFRTLAGGSETLVRDENLRLGQGYCYRLDISGGGSAAESHTRCATTDWRVGFEGLSITRTESAEVLRLFDWRDTQTLPEGTVDAPALYHMNLLIEGGDPLAPQGFRTMGMHVQGSPIFPEELDVWNDAHAVAQDCGFNPVVVARALGPIRGDTVLGGGCVPVGRWFFTAVPGRVYNEIRARMLEQINAGESPGVRALVFRRVPVAAALAPGVSRHVLGYSYLGEQGFEFNAIQRCRMLNGVRVCEVRQEILGWLARKVIHWAAELVDSAVEGVRSAIGRIARLVKGEVTLDLQFRLLNTDPAFGTDQVMRSGWSGAELKLADVRVEVRQGLAGFYGQTDENGFVHLIVAKDSNTKVCVQVENDTAEITEYLLEKTVCLKNLGKLGGNRSETIDARHDYLNALAAMTDAREYMSQVVGITMPKITVLVGEQADGLAAAGRSFAPCMGRVPSLIGLGTDLLGLLGSLVNPAFLVTTTAIEFFYSVDIVLRSDNDSSRGVPVHEYGHAVMCDMLLRQGIDAFELAWTDIIRQTASQSPGNEASYLNEAFADFLTAQVVGGTNYFAASDSTPSENVNYCEAGKACLEVDGRQRGTFSGQVERVVTTLLDAFDGPDGVATANDGSHWETAATPFTHHGGNDSNRNDETVVLPASDIRALFEYWDERGTLLREDNFLGGLADLAKARGYAEAEVCGLFALHEVGRSCPGFIARRPWLDWLQVADAGLLEAFAAAPAPGVAAAGPGAPSAGPPALMLAIASAAPQPAPDAGPGPAPRPTTAAPTARGSSCSRVSRSSRCGGSGRASSRRPSPSASAPRPSRASTPSAGSSPALGAAATPAAGSSASTSLLRRRRTSKRLLVASAQDLGVDADSLRATGPAKIELRLAEGRRARREDRDPLRGRGRWSQPPRELRSEAPQHGGVSFASAPGIRPQGSASAAGRQSSSSLTVASCSAPREFAVWTSARRVWRGSPRAGFTR